MASNRIRRLAFALVSVTLLGVASCSSSGSDADKASTGKGTSSSTTEAAGETATTAGGSAGTGKALSRYADYKTKSYDDPGHWVCRPDTPKDLCHGDLDSTEVAADGTLTVQPFKPAADPKVDCFYVYPTISRDQSNYSDWKASDDEEGFVTLNQAARLQSVCRLFAPVYRQGTLAGLAGRIGGGDPKFSDQGDPYADVLDAFRTYMAQDNEGRGVVLIGHSQGAGILDELIKKEIDPNADVRAKLVGAYLAGGSVAVPDGKLVGGDFTKVPLCSKDGEPGCVTTWATFRATAPPPSGTFFGKVRGGKAGQVAGCVSPADPSGSKGDVEAKSYFPADAKASILSSLGAGQTGGGWIDPSAGKVTTPYVSVPGLVSVQCQAKDGVHYLQATVHPSPDGPRADDIPGDLTPEWGLHLVDVNLVMGDVVAQVGDQADAYAG